VGDQGRLRQILVNLLGNAVKFTEQGAVTLTVTQLRDQNEKSTLRFEIRDTGPGLREEERTSLFQKYFQTKVGMKVGGTGLGLSISKQLVDLMGGSIGVESVYGAGSTFWFTIELPVCEALELRPKMEVSFAKLFKGTVLVAEDQIVNQRVASNYLQKLGLKVEIASQGQMALEKVTQGSYDLIFMDCQMPVMNGFDATIAIRKFEKENSRKPTPIIALTADAARADDHSYEDAGMNDYLAKPLELAKLIAVLHRWLKSDESVIDQKALAKLEKFVTKDQNLIAALIEDFSASAPELIAAIQNGIESEDLTSVSESAHALKSASAALGATALAQLCQRLEDCESLIEAKDLLAPLEARYKKSLNELLALKEEKLWQKSS
ncbi:MAG TPA: ATP-binding protein, partial [Bdellovibrio sp.]|nr:ATP-binding protein [Bdellovibrio sp.]